jgi:pimeloyl-ACP methyl ester carboxylesterase
VFDEVVSVATAPVRLVAESGVGQRAVGIANGVFGENADARGGTLPAAMTVRVEGRPVEVTGDAIAAEFPRASGRVVVFVHGLVETERSWFHQPAPEKSRTGTDFGSRLAVDLPSTPVYLRYNTGRRVSDNGNELVGLLSDLVDAWPVPVTDLVLVGHSMGGLVVRSAVLQAHEQGRAWLSRVIKVVCLGTPHTGAHLERVAAWAGSVLDRFVITAPLARLLALRSDGIKDLALGHVHRSQPTGSAPKTAQVPPPGVRQCFVFVTLARSQTSLSARLIGDLLVTPASAGDRTQTADHRWLGGLHHFDLLNHDTVYDSVLDWLRS